MKFLIHPAHVKFDAHVLAWREHTATQVRKHESMDLKSAYTMLMEIDRVTLRLCQSLSASSQVEPDERIAAAEAILMLQKDRKLLVAEIMKGAYGARYI